MQEVKEQLSTEEELFCTRYELEILSGIVNRGMLERWVPGFCNPQTHKEHELRYDWVKEFVRNKAVLDIACGTGFGSYKLADEGGAAKITAWDIDKKTIQYASLKNKHSNIVFEVKNAEEFDGHKQFDVIISFETIEHLSKPESFLNNINRALVINGVCFISTPISDVTENTQPGNIYHQREWGFKRFQELAGNYLRIEEVYLQLYSSPPRIKAGFFLKILQKAGLKNNNALKVIEKLRPHRWNPKELKEESIGIEWTGYQILKCSKKTDARA